ncbi:MAG: hypothetical protein NC311_09915 [Muribaculaceae bacterium]|nr:hypothetical protein [Muribaculaceae bacterium]
MGETKIFSFPEQGGAFGGGSAMEGAMLGSMMSNGGMMGGNGMWNSPWWALIFLSAFRNGGFFGSNDGGNGGGGSNQARFDAIQEQLSTIQGQNALMSAITGGTSEVKALAGTLNCDINAVQGAINAVQTAICNLQNSNNMNTQSIMNAVSAGDQGIIRQLCDCCCSVKQLITEQGYQNQIANLNQTNALTGAINSVAIGQERGFSAVAYAAADQTCQLKQNANDNTRAILAKLDAMEDSRKDREIASLTAALTAANARSERQAELQPIYNQLNEIACNQPPVKKISCPESYVPVNNSINAMYGLIPTGFCGGYNLFNAAALAGLSNGFTNAF